MSLVTVNVAKKQKTISQFSKFKNKFVYPNVSSLGISENSWSLDTAKQLRKKYNADGTSILKDAEPLYKTTLINNRRYLGNKYKLLPFIKKTIRSKCKNVSVIADIFAGTGAVSSAFLDKTIITNDLMYSNYICHYAWFSNEAFSEEKIKDYIVYFNGLELTEENYMTKNFADTYFSFSDCSKIGFIRESIEVAFSKNFLNSREKALLITSLLYAMDKIANTCGHYDAYRKNVPFEKSLELSVPVPSLVKNNNHCYNLDANDLVKTISADLVYIDPPYNSRQYSDAYHLLENVARWEKPEVKGVAKKMDRAHLKSDYCTVKATEAFEDLIENIDAKYIVLSYNNMAEKGNDRSNAKLTDDDIMRILSKKGSVTVHSEYYKAFTTGKSNIAENQERLFICKCNMKKKTKNLKNNYLQSPLNYIGGKHKLLPQILPLFPKKYKTFVDLFCGGGNVGINIDCDTVIFNDKHTELMYLFNTFKNLEKETVFAMIDSVIAKYQLSDSSKNGYSFYACKSDKGLADYNKDKFLKLRSDFNNTKNLDYMYYIMLYVLIVYSFNNQIRFNAQGKFNLPVGKRDFNDKMKKKLTCFIDKLQCMNAVFLHNDFRAIDISSFNDDTFVYIDPPYLITCATYNEQDGWNEQSEKDLLAFIDDLSDKGIKFALSNVLRSKGKENQVLIDWINKNTYRYKVVELDYHYSNSNYQTKDKSKSACEVLIINY